MSLCRSPTAKQSNGWQRWFWLPVTFLRCLAEFNDNDFRDAGSPMSNTSEIDSGVRLDPPQGRSDRWHLWRVSCRDDQYPVGSFGEWCGAEPAGDAGYTKNSSSIPMTYDPKLQLVD